VFCAGASAGAYDVRVRARVLMQVCEVLGLVQVRVNNRAHFASYTRNRTGTRTARTRTSTLARTPTS
jgi:hypothetical protein